MFEYLINFLNTINLTEYILPIILVFIFIFIYIKIMGKTMKKKPARHGLAGYHIIYADQKEENKKDSVDYGILLYSSKYNLQGKPDYIFQSNIRRKRLVPIEIKSGEIGDKLNPHKGDMLQLATYFLIIQDVYGNKPRFGRLVYKDYMFVIKNTARLRREVREVTKRMRIMLKDGEENANASFVSCKHCICNGTVCEYCDQKKMK